MSRIRFFTDRVTVSKLSIKFFSGRIIGSKLNIKFYSGRFIGCVWIADFQRKITTFSVDTLFNHLFTSYISNHYSNFSTKSPEKMQSKQSHSFYDNL